MTSTASNLTAALLASALLLSAAEGADREFSETVDTVVVEVPVQVLDGEGRPVRGLTAQDFAVYEGRKRQSLVGFEEIDLARMGSAVEAEPVPIVARRHFLFLFDLTFSDPLSVTKAREAAQTILHDELYPSDLVGVATYSVLEGPRLVLGFTSDRRQAELAIERLGILQRQERITDPLGLVVADPNLMSESMGRAGAGTGAGGGLNVGGAAEEHFADLGREMQKETRQERIGQAEAFVKGLGVLGEVLASVQGRKHLVLLSQGVDTSLMLGTEDRGRIEAMAQASSVGQYWEVDSQERYGSTAAVNVLEEALESLRRADVAIQSVDVAGLVAGQGRSQTQDSLLTFAKDTGGQFFANTNDLSRGMGEMLDTTSVSYLLAFQPEDLALDGSYHRIKVELAGAGRGTRVVHRPGYYAPKPYSERSALERRLDAAEKIVSGQASGSLDAAMLAAAFPGDAKGSWVPVLVEVRGEDLLDLAKPPDVLPVEIYVYAVDAEGRVRDFYSKSVGLDLSKVGDTLRRSGLKLFGSLDLAPGDYTLRLLVRDGLTGRAAVRTASLNVPGEGSSDTLLLAPLFPEDPNRWLMVQDVDEARSRGIAYPFLIEETPFVPSARPVVAKGSTVPVALMAYNLGSGEIEVGSRLLDAEGNELFAPRLEILSRAREGSPTRMRAELETPAVDSGTYVLEVTVRQGDRLSRSSIPLVIEQG